MPLPNGKLVRIGIFYDGNSFFHVSNYYQYHHERRARISISGLHRFVRQQIAEYEGTDARYCQIVDAHYFRGRLRATDAEEMNLLFKERVFDDVLIREGVTTHYLPLSREGEKGIDVWLALEAFELAMARRFDVAVLVACDGDFLPLVRKLYTTGTRVMVLGWDFKYVDRNGNERETRTAQVLLDEVTYPLMMNPVIDDRTRRNDPLLNNLFVPRKDFTLGPRPMITTPANAPPNLAPPPPAPNHAAPPAPAPAPAPGSGLGSIQALKNGYGFITPDQGGPTMFFFHGDVLEPDFLDLRPGDRVQYEIGTNDRGPCAKQVHRVATESGSHGVEAESHAEGEAFGGEPQ